ncbi:MAG: hypothetical protein Q7S10_02980 [bacterium]|nr:hypothetical protein [bacterium]
MNEVVLRQVLGSLGTAIESLMALKKVLQDLLPKEEPPKEKVEEQCAPPPSVPSSPPPEVEEDEVAVDLEEEFGLHSSDADLPRRSQPKVCLDAKISFSFEGTISVRE